MPAGDSSLEDEIQELKTKLSKTEVEYNELKTKLSKIRVENTTEDALTETLKALLLSTVQFPSYKTGENFSRFCEKFKETFKSAEITNSCVKTKIMQNVDDGTYEALKAIPIPENMRYNLDDVCEIFETAMCNPVSSISLTKSQLYETKQTAGETVLEFISRIREAVSIAGIPESDRDEVKVMMLVRGVSNSRVKKKVAMNMEKSFEEVVLLVKEVMAIDCIIFGEENSASSSAQVMKVAHRSRERYNYERDYSRDRSRDNRNRERERYNDKRFESGNRYRSNGSGKNQSQERRCYICDEKGHFCRNCPRRRRNLN